MVNGKNTVFVVATDNDGKRGAIYSKFVDLAIPAQVTTLSGKTVDAITALPISHVSLEINNSFVTSDVSGNYLQHVLPMTAANVVAKASGYVTQVVDNFDVVAGQTITKDFQLEPFCDYSLDTIESGVNSWVADAPWGITTGKSVSPSHSWTDSPSGNYQDNISTSLTSEVLDVSNFVGFKLTFNSYCDTEADYDYGHVEVRFDGGDWQEIYTCDGDASWKAISKDVTIMPNLTTMQYRFRLTTDEAFTRDGWYIDDVKLTAAGNVCHSSNPDVLFKNSFE